MKCFLESVAFWTPTLPGWPAARSAFRDESEPLETPAGRPSPEILAPAERRRVPDSVALALEVASAATRDAAQDASALPSIFASAHGDLAVNDYMCKTLATQPALISPIKFHNSVHNAAAGYWTIGTGCRAASSALTAFEHSFAAGLLEAMTQCAADATPVLLVAFDVQAVGALATVTTSEGLLATAVVLSPEPTARSMTALEASLQSGRTEAPSLRSAAARALSRNAMADALPLLEAVANTVAGPAASAIPLPVSSPLPSPILLPLSRSLALRIALRPVA